MFQIKSTHLLSNQDPIFSEQTFATSEQAQDEIERREKRMPEEFNSRFLREIIKEGASEE